MRKTFSAFHLVLSAICVLCLFGTPAYAQFREKETRETIEHPNGIVQDWSARHVVYPRVGEIHSLIAVQNDPRAILSWQAAIREGWRQARTPRHFPDNETHRDWSISLGGGTTAPAMYPAKFTFNTSAAPTCTALSPAVPDYVVYPVNVAGGVAQPNIVAFDNLYSGTVPAAGICNRAPSGSDTGVAATTFWSYNIHAAGGIVSTSPALSLDGTKVAFVETGSGAAHFHVLAWKAGDGVLAANLQSVLSPVTITSGFAALAPAAGSGTVTDLILGSSNDTLSSPFVDYTNDLAYIGNDSGVLFRVKNVFCTTPTCTVGVTAAPSLDASWGSSGALTIGGTCLGKLTGAVVDGGTGHVFVGCSDGKLYGFTSAGVALTNPSVTVGNGAATGGIVDPPLIDAVRGLAYVVSGASSGGTSVLVQAKTADLSSTVTATLGAGGSFSLHAPSFDDDYYTSGVSTNWLIYEWALNGAGTNITLYGSTFNGSHTMNGGVPAHSITVGGSVPVEFSPTTEFLNSGSDQFYVSGLVSASPNFIEYNLNVFVGLFPTSFPPSGVAGATTAEGSGTTGMVVDNVSASAQASSIYFGVLASNTAVKLTQSGLQ